jgi:hypothetical protein
MIIPSIPSPFEGNWNVAEATLPDGRFAYTGAITIQRLATTYSLDWDISAGRYVGLGLALDEHLWVSCGEQYAGLGLALYQFQPDGQVTIQWSTAEMGGSLGTGLFTSPWPGAFAGDHRLVYYLPDGRLYGEWSLSIQKVERIYELAWRKGEAVHWQGLGLDAPHGLVASWYPDVKQLACLDYRADPDDRQRLTAVWALGGYTSLGTETLTRWAEDDHAGKSEPHSLGGD